MGNYENVRNSGNLPLYTLPSHVGTRDQIGISSIGIPSIMPTARRSRVWTITRLGYDHDAKKWASEPSLRLETSLLLRCLLA